MLWIEVVCWLVLVLVLVLVVVVLVGWSEKELLLVVSSVCVDDVGGCGEEGGRWSVNR